MRIAGDKGNPIAHPVCNSLSSSEISEIYIYILLLKSEDLGNASCLLCLQARVWGLKPDNASSNDSAIHLQVTGQIIAKEGNILLKEYLPGDLKLQTKSPFLLYVKNFADWTPVCLCVLRGAFPINETFVNEREMTTGSIGISSCGRNAIRATCRKKGIMLILQRLPCQKRARGGPVGLNLISHYLAGPIYLK